MGIPLVFSVIVLSLPLVAQSFSVKKGSKTKSGITLMYQLFFPTTNEGEARKLPLVVFFHGAGERGNDNQAQLVHGVGRFLQQMPTRNFILLAPQCPLGHRWVETDWTEDSHQMPAEPSKPMEVVLDLLDSLVGSNSIDLSRIYVTGISMGGFATWDILARQPDLFAAAVPICGGADLDQAPLLKDIPIWAFHGMNDKVVKPSRSINMVSEIQRKNGNAILTLYPKVGHDSWTQTYANDLLFDWLFAQKKLK